MMNFITQLFISEEGLSSDKDRKTYLLSSINFVLMFFFLIVLIVQFFDEVFFAHPVDRENFFLIFILILVLYSTMFLIKKGLIRSAIFSTILPVLFFAFKISWTLGINSCAISMLYSFIILMSAVLVNFKFSFFIFLFICSGLLFIYYLQNSTYFVNNSILANSSLHPSSLLIILITFSLIIFLSWLVSKEIAKIFKKNKKLIRELKLQNDNFAIIIKKKIGILKEAHLQQLTEIAPLLDLGKLSVGLIHDIRESLAILSIILQTAQENKNVVSDLDKAFLAIDKIDDLSKMSACKIFDEVDLDFFNLNKEIEKLLSLFEYSAKLRKAKIIFQPNKEYELYSDRAKLIQVLSNLILNALEAYDYFEQNDRYVFIKLVRKPRNLLIIVKDYGAGITKENLPYIFEPRFSCKDHKQSLGLGLYVSQETIKRVYESKIKVESRVNHGSTFTILIKNKFVLNEFLKKPLKELPEESSIESIEH